MTKKWQLQKLHTIQSLWSGYGEIARYQSKKAAKTVIIKRVQPPSEVDHPRGWNTSLSHERKLHSYQSELNFYCHYLPLLPDISLCRVPTLLDYVNEGEQLALLLEDVDAAGFKLRKNKVKTHDIKACLSWLAKFHGFFLNRSSEGLWPVGSYWHLATRPDELKAMPDGPLKEYAFEIDKHLRDGRFQTLIHGDAKLANFCFATEFSNINSQSVAALDFQYVGKGPGIKDVMLFLGSCLHAPDLFNTEKQLLDHYFSTLRQVIQKHHPDKDYKSLEAEWRELYSFAWTDFHRFLAGWKPDHVKINAYMEAQTQQCLSQISV